MKIVIADDSVMIRGRLMEALSGIDNIEIVGEAINGIEALKIINDKTPDFVIMDIRMPEMNGIAVLEKLKEQGSKSKVCIFTNYPYVQYKQKCMEEGAKYFFDKNHDFQKVLTLIDKLSKVN
jgi:YesN/AraC family two-component response regulator